jgi:hypothetical protein
MLLIACASDADAPPKTPGTMATAAATSSGEATAPRTVEDAATPTTGGEIEATGIVGAVDENNGVIEIRPTGGGTVTRVEVAPGARIRLATGGTLALSEVRSSDRIVANGVAGETADTIVADEIEISRVVPGAAPGG